MKTEIPGGKWSTFHVKSELDLIMGRASKLPAPGQYGNPERRKINGGRISHNEVQGSVDALQARSRKIPGPGQYDVDSAYEHSTFCNKIKTEEEMRHRRASSSLGCSRLYDASSFHDHGGGQEDSSFCQSLALTQSTDISDLIERYSKVTRATTASGSMGVGLFNPRDKNTRHILGDFAGGDFKTTIEDVYAMAPPIGDPRRGAYVRRHLPLVSG